MKEITTTFSDVYLITTKKFEDDRGFFMESFNLNQFKKITGVDHFVQDNHSKSSKGVLRGLHYQIKNPQGKLIRCIFGTIVDVVVDLRISSPTFGKSQKFLLDRNDIHLWVPSGFAHGFCVLSDEAEVVYKTTDYYYPEYDRTLLWNDSDLKIDWQIDGNIILSEKDLNGKTFRECEKYA